MALTITTARSAPAAAKLVGIGVFTDDDRPDDLPKDLLDSRGFDAKLGKTMIVETKNCLLYTSPSPRDATLSRMPSSA